jgi:Asp-tRNA(Asn)/Glu-tRNA(Gln) amidotransferase C subunit
MKVTEKDVAYVADLANLELTPQESLRMVADLNSILGPHRKAERAGHQQRGAARPGGLGLCLRRRGRR